MRERVGERGERERERKKKIERESMRKKKGKRGTVGQPKREKERLREN